jgi:pimeloyl-ACP methyl ester carboxylesterase
MMPTSRHDIAGQKTKEAEVRIKDPVKTVVSADGTRIAYDTYGEGPLVVIVAAVTSDRNFNGYVALAKALSGRFRVVTYDRRGRGDSTEVSPFAVEREIEDLAAVIDAEGGHAHIWGGSSGGALSLRTVAAGIAVDRLAVYEVPFMVDPAGKMPTADFSLRLDELAAAGDRRGALKHFLRNALGLPAPLVSVMPLLPVWKRIEAMAHTLRYDWAALGDHNMHGNPLRADEWSAVTVPTLVAYGAKSPSSLQKGSLALAEVLPNARLQEISGMRHNLKAKVLAPVLAEFFGKDSSSPTALGISGEREGASAS